MSSTQGSTSGYSTSYISKLGLGQNTLADLFDLGVPKCQCGKSIQDLLDQNLPIFVIYTLMIAAREQESTENFVSSIQSQQKRQKLNSTNLIQERLGAQSKREELASDEANWKARVNIDRTGLARKDDPPKDDCIKAIVVGILFVIGILTGTLLIMLAVAVVLTVVCSIVTQIAKAAIKSHAQMRTFEKVMGWLNPADLLADAVVGVVCTLGGYDPNDERIQKLRMGLKLALNILASIALVIAGIAATVLTGGAAGPLVAMAIMGAITGIIQLVCAIMEYKQAEKELQLAKDRFALNKILAVVEQLKLELETISQELDLLIDMFSSKMSEVREEYEKASRILKEYNETKRSVAQNIRS
jgi:uncharacterized membrane protein